MQNKTKFDHLTYFETSTCTEYSSKPQGALNAGRLAQGKADCWQKLTPAGTVKKKDLILADWWAESWDPLTRSRVKVLLAELLGEGFKLYVWLDPDLKLLDDINLLNEKDWCKQIKPEFKDVLTAKATAQLKLPNDKLAVLQRVELESLLGQTPEESKTINALHLAFTTHSIEKIRAVEASASSTFETALLAGVSTQRDDPYYETQKIKNILTQNWTDTRLTEKYQTPYLTYDSSIYLNEAGGVCVDKSSKESALEDGESGQYKIEPKGTYNLTKGPSYLGLDFMRLDSITASALEKLFTPELVGLEVNKLYLNGTPFLIKPENLANLQYLSFGASCPPEIFLNIITAAKLRDLKLDADRYRYPEDMKVADIANPEDMPSLEDIAGLEDLPRLADIANPNDQRFAQLNCLTLTNCTSRFFEIMLINEMPELHSLVIAGNLDHPFEIRRSLDKLKSLTVSGNCDAKWLESLTKSAVNCNLLNLSQANLTGSFSQGFHLPKVTSLALGPLNHENAEACLAAQTIINTASAVTSLEITGNISGYSFMTAVPARQVRSLRLNDSGVISAETLRPILSNMMDLNEVTINRCEAYQWDEELSSLLNNRGKISLFFEYASSMRSISKKIDISGLESIKISHQFFSNRRIVNGIDNLFQSASRLKSLSVNDDTSNFDFIHKLALLPQTVETLNLSSHILSAENLKKMLRAMPRLRFLTISGNKYTEANFKEWEADKELQSLLSHIAKVTLPHTYEKLEEEFTTQQFYSESGLGNRLVSITPENNLASSLSQKRNPSEPFSVDADTTPVPNKTFHLTRMFHATSGDNHPCPSHYRLGTYNHVSLSNEPGSQQPFILENTGDLDLIDCPQLIPVSEVFKLGKDVTKGGHLGRQVFELDSKWHPIASLSTTDHISHYHISDNHPHHEIKYSKRDDLFYIRSTTGSQTVTLDFVVRSPNVPPPIIMEQEVQNWIDTFRGFGEGELKLSSQNPTSQEYLNALIEQKVGACRHRSVAFKALMEQKYPELGVRIVANDCHMFVEIRQNQKWVRCDLGGYQAKLTVKEIALAQDKTPTKSKIVHTEMRYLSEQQRRFEKCFETWDIGRDPRADNAKLYVEGILNGQHKKQLIHVPAHDIAALNMAIQTQAIRTNHPVFYIHSPDDLVCSARFVRREGHHGTLCFNSDGGGPLHDFLTAKVGKIMNAKILIVNYARFSADDIVRFNGLLDEKRSADGTPLPENAVVIGLIDPDKPGAYHGKDFYSRFDTVEQCPLTTIPSMVPVLKTMTKHKQPIGEYAKINLCHASNWMTQLMGGWTLVHGELYFEEGKLVSALKSQLPIVIQNPPVDSAFDVFWQQARLRQSITYAGASYPFPENVPCFSDEGYDWNEIQKRISWDNNTPSNALVLNPINLNEFLVQYQFDESKLFTRVPGLLAEHAAKNPNSPLYILVTRSLSQDEWGIFLNEAEQHKTLKLVISCSPGVTLPDALVPKMVSEVTPLSAWNKAVFRHTICIVSDDPDLTIAEITSSQVDCIVLNISECTASDLIKRVHGKLEKQDFVFYETEQAVLTSLHEGKNVVLTGTFSDELLDGLAPFIRQRANTPNSPGQLILVSQQPVGYMDTVSHQITQEEKREALKKQGFSDANLECLEQESPSCIATQPFTLLSTRLQFQRAHPDKTSLVAWAGLSALRSAISIRKFDPKTSESDAKNYLNARLIAFNQVIEDKPYVFLAGLTGVGKSRFVENELNDRTLFHGEASIGDWLCAAPAVKPTLFLDEANLSTREWSELEGLFNTPPGLLIDGKYHLLTKHHKVIFAGNPLSYGDERKLAPLLARHGNSIVFEPLSNAFVYEKTLKPILEEQLASQDYELVAKELLRAYDFLIGVSRDDVLISPRQIQMMALAVIDYHVRFPRADIQNIAKFQARHIAYNLVPRQHLERFHQEFPPIDRTELLKEHEHSKPEFKNFLATPSRDMALWQLTDFLSLRTFQRQKEIHNPSLRSGGLHRLVIEGDPGVGKSKMAIELMQGMGLCELKLGDKPTLEKKNGFYRLLASMQPSVQKDILLTAFDDGAIVLIDEINSIPTLEKMLNSLLDGKHPIHANRPPLNPGFRVLGTQNPPTMAGRRMASPALENRTQTIRLSTYSEKEMDAILEKMGVASVTTRAELIKAFQSKVEEAKIRHLTPAPSFRNLIRMAENLVEGHSKSEEKKASKDNEVSSCAPDEIESVQSSIPVNNNYSTFSQNFFSKHPDDDDDPFADYPKKSS